MERVNGGVVVVYRVRARILADCKVLITGGAPVGQVVRLDRGRTQIAARRLKLGSTRCRS